MQGVKYDSHKPDMSLLPPLSLQEVAKVLTFGADKYSPDNWRHVDNAQRRYTSAALRHITSHMAGSANDDESSLDHLAHAICCLMFKLELKLEESKSQGAREADSREYRESDLAIEPVGWFAWDNQEGSMRNPEYILQYDPFSKDYRRIPGREGLYR